MNNPKLLLLDINGLLCKKVAKNINTNLQTIDLHSYRVILRPYYKEFLHFRYTHFHIGFYSSTSQRNADIILKGMLTENQMHDTCLFWFRDQTKLDIESTNEYDTVKPLNDVYHYFNGFFNKTNTLLIDDSYQKIRYNDMNNILLCHQFKGVESDTHLIELMSMIVYRYDMIKL